MEKNLFSPQFPTFPATDKFGQTIMYFGASKIETAVIQIASGLLANSNLNSSPETIAENSYAIAIACFEKIDEELKKAVAVSGNATTIICPPESKL